MGFVNRVQLKEETGQEYLTAETVKTRFSQQANVWKSRQAGLGMEVIDWPVVCGVAQDKPNTVAKGLR